MSAQAENLHMELIANAPNSKSMQTPLPKADYPLKTFRLLVTFLSPHGDRKYRQRCPLDVRYAEAPVFQAYPR